MKNVFHRQLYIEGLKKVMIPGIISAIIVMSRAVLLPMVRILFASPDTEAFVRAYDEFAADVSSLLLLAPILIYCMFSFLNKRKQADFYHAIPVKRSCMLTTLLASVYTWVWGILLAAVSLSALLWWLSGDAVISFSSLLLTIGMYMVATLYIGGFVILAMTISGTGFSNLTVTCLLMFSFRIFCLIFYSALNTKAPALDISYTALAIFDVKYWFPVALAQSTGHTGVLYDPLLWIFTGVVMIGCYLLAYLGFVKRKSQHAEKTASEPWLRRLYSTLVAMPLMFVAFILWFIVGDSGSISFILLALTVGIYYIYELISTKKPREALSSLKFLFIPAACCICFVIAIHVIAYSVNHTYYKAEEIQAVRIYSEGSAFDSHTDLYKLYSYEEIVTREIKVDDEEARQIVADALKQTLDDTYRFSISDYESYVEEYVEITLVSGQTIGRKICFATQEYQRLQNVLNASDERVEQYLKLPSDDEILLYEEAFHHEQIGEFYAKKIWDVFVAEYQRLPKEEKLLYKQQNVNKETYYENENIVCLRISGSTDQHVSFTSTYAIPSSFTETRKAYFDAIKAQQESILRVLGKLSAITVEEFRKQYGYINMEGTIQLGEKTYFFHLGADFDDTNIGKEQEKNLAKLKDFVSILLPNTVKDFGDQDFVTISLYRSFGDRMTHQKFALGIAAMSEDERAAFLAQLQNYLTEEN